MVNTEDQTLAEEIVQRLSDIGRQTEAAFASIDWHSVARSVRALEGEVKSLAAQGWTIPMWATPSEVVEILRHTQEGKIDDFFVRYYSTDDARHLQRLRTELSSAKRYTRWIPLLEQSFDGYNQGMYLVVVPSLLTVLDGAVAQAGGPEAWRSTNVKNVAAKTLQSASSNSITRVIWASIVAFISNVFQYHDFADDRLAQINRHWILHGRDVPDWGQADCLRLFQAIHTIRS